MKMTIYVFLFIFSFVLRSSFICAQDTIPMVSESSLKVSDSLQTFAKVEVESEFPGGRDAWGKFLVNNLTYPAKAVRKRIQGTVILQFIVDKDGTVYDVEALSGDPLLRHAALDVMKKSPKWIPARQSGKNVKSYKKQPIAFRLN